MNRQQAEELLPWYVAGALNAEEARAVQAFIDSGEIPRAAVDELAHLQRAVAEQGVEEPRYDPAVLDRAMARLDGTPQARAAAVPAKAAAGAAQGGWRTLLERLQWSLTPPLAKVAIAAQFALLLVLAAVVTVGRPGADGEYEVVSGSVPGQYTVAFAPGVSEAEVRALLLANGAGIVSGPTALGFYHITFDAGVDAAAAAERLAASELTAYLEAVP